MTRPAQHEYELVNIEDEDLEFDSKPKGITRKKSHNETFQQRITKEAKTQGLLAKSFTWTLVLMFLPSTISISFVGTYTGPRELDATSYATRFTNVVGSSIIIGLCSAIDTLGSQTVGANNPKALGYYMQQGLAIIGCVFIGFCYAVFHAEAILLSLNQPPEVASLAQEFAIILIPAIAFNALSELLRRALQTFEIVRPFTLGASGALVVEIGATWLFLAYFETGVLGAAWARVLSSAFLTIYTYIYVVYYRIHEQFWYGWDTKALNPLDWGKWVTFGVPGVFQLSLEWWAVEIYAIYCGWLDNPEKWIAVHAICGQIAQSMYLVYFGPTIAAGVRIGNRLGSGDGEGARESAVAGMLITLLLGLIGGLFVYTFRSYLVLLFVGENMDAEFVETVIYYLKFTATFQLFDATNAMACGIFRACGRQALAVAIVFVAFWIIGLGLGYVLSFSPLYQWGYTGIISSWIFAAAFQVVVSVVTFVVVIDWQKLGESIHEKRKLQS